MSDMDKIKARIRDLWGTGLSTSKIGKQCGVSKNSVVGHAHRMNLPPRPSPIRERYADAPPAKLSPKMSRETLDTILPVKHLGRGQADSARHAVPVEAVRQVMQAAPVRVVTKRCCWPVGNPGTAEFTFCPAAGLQGKRYCELHTHVSAHGWTEVEHKLWSPQRDSAVLKLIAENIAPDAIIWALNEYPGPPICSYELVERRRSFLMGRKRAKAA